MMVLCLYTMSSLVAWSPGLHGYSKLFIQIVMIKVALKYVNGCFYLSVFLKTDPLTPHPPPQPCYRLAFMGDGWS